MNFTEHVKKSPPAPGSLQGAECRNKGVEPGPHATTPPFFQATIAKSSQSNLQRHKTALRESDTHQGISLR